MQALDRPHDPLSYTLPLTRSILEPLFDSKFERFTAIDRHIMAKLVDNTKMSICTQCGVYVIQ
eukprot:scaffold229838_cov50-Cyclotella_meneghiniana.AAC.3